MVAVEHAAHRGVSNGFLTDVALVDQELPGLHAYHDLFQVEVGHLFEPLVKDLLTMLSSQTLPLKSPFGSLYLLHLGQVDLALRVRLRLIFAFFTFGVAANLLELSPTLVIVRHALLLSNVSCVSTLSGFIILYVKYVSS